MEETKYFQESIGDKKTIDYNLEGGRFISRARLGEEVVISGISGSFPCSNNIRELEENLYGKVNMMTTQRRWNFDHPEIPPYLGTIPEIEQYDAGFFGVHERQSNSMDPMGAILQEKTLEAIFDAGLHPTDLENTRTGVFVGSCYSEDQETGFFGNLCPNSYVMTGSEKSMLAHRLNYFLKLKGPSFDCDTACSSSLFALEHAYRAIRMGEIDNAIVGGTNLCLHPFATLQFARLGVLSMDGVCKTFDISGNGYVRSEAIGVLFLQRASKAKRIYSEVIYVKTNCDGYKEQGVTFPSRDAQKKLLSEFYDECGIDRYSLSFMEAHGTGTVVGDIEECSTIDEVFTKERATPLLIGSVKSNIGHSEPASGVCSIVKCIIGMENGFMPPNISYTAPRPEILGLVEGRMKVITENTRLDEKGLVGINSFGVGGANCHVLLRWNPKTKTNHNFPKDDLSRLVCLSGRTEEAVLSLLHSVADNKFDGEYVKLFHDSFRKNVEGHSYRGYSVGSQLGELVKSSKLLKNASYNSPPLQFVFGEMNNWYEIGCDLMVLPTFSAYIQRIQQILPQQEINIADIFLKRSSNKDLDFVLGSVIVQIGLIRIFELIEIKPSAQLGHSIGELVYAYNEEHISLEETISYAFSIGQALNQVLDSCNNNNKKNKNVTGNDTVNGYDVQTENKEVFDYVRTSLISEDLTLIDNLVQSSSMKVFKSDRNFKLLRRFVHAIFKNSSPTFNSFSENAIVIKIGNAPLTGKALFGGDATNYFAEFLKGLGSLYELGYNPQISHLYPPVELPVSRGTGMISPYIKWNHRKPKRVSKYYFDTTNKTRLCNKSVGISDKDRRWEYIEGHVIDGRNLFPAIGYLYIVWDTFLSIKNLPITLMNVRFENCKFIRATTLSKKGNLALHVSIQPSGNFEVVEGGSVVVTGKIFLLQSNEELGDLDLPSNEYKNSTFKLKSIDVYKELRLRGYNYKGDFRAIQECDVTATEGYIKWEDNYVTFIDNMLQLKIVQSDTRLLYVPTFIAKLTIMATLHSELISSKTEKDQKDILLPVWNNPATGVVRCGGISVSGLIASSIPRRKLTAEPVLESYKFVSNTAELNIYQSVRVNTQIILENSLMHKVKGVELIDKFTNKDDIPLTPIIQSALDDQPLIQPSLKILSQTPLEDSTIEVENKDLSTETDCMLIIASNVVDRPDVLNKATSALAEDGFIICRENYDNSNDVCKDLGPGFSLLTIHRIATEILLLFRKRSKTKKSKYIKISATPNFDWLYEVQKALNNNNVDDIVLYAENEPKSGILGLVNCLRREPESKHVRCVLMMDKTEEFEPQNSFYSDQLSKQMAINVYQNGQWGTYRHLTLDELNYVESEHCFANVTARGDLSSLRWIEGPLRHNMIEQPGKELIHVYYSTLNFRDVMTATGKINADVITKDRLLQECVQGIEFSGRDKNGKRCMGMMACGALSTLVMQDTHLKFPIPDDMSFEDAATIPVVYCTVIYGLILRGPMRRGESILIHSGTGGIGQAAIRLALHYGCKVFTTVGTQEKREFLKNTFPQLKDDNIGNSRDESFEQLVLAGTNGRGVDLVLNSLSEEKLVASVRCLAPGGRFIEIGKFDLANNNHINLLLLQKGASFHGVMLDRLFSEPPSVLSELVDMVMNYIKCGAIKPLNKTIFKHTEIEKAFRFMATGKHTGKVLIQIRKPEKKLIAAPSVVKFSGISRFFCNPDKVYIILGGLGGVGLELADWLILRGARKVVLTSRKGITTGYQAYRLRIWESYDITVKISTASITRDGCRQLIEDSLKLGPVDAIFNLAVVLADSIFEHQTSETFAKSFGPKACCTEYLDVLTRQLCPDLSQFVVFSSVSCGRGNAGQTNYGMSNSVMERICEDRKRAGYPALAIQWGAIGEVGLVAEMLEEDVEIEIGGTLQQRISSCFQVLDTLLRQTEESVVSSMVVAEKRVSRVGENIVDSVLSILGITDSKSVSFHSTLTEMGMDSMTAIEIRQVLERNFELTLSPKDLRTITLAKLKEIQEKETIEDVNQDDVNNFKLEFMFKLIGEKSQKYTPCVSMESKVSQNETAPTLLLFPGIEGLASIFQGFTKWLSAHTVGLQLNYAGTEQTIAEMAETVLPNVEKYFPNKVFHLVRYSYGTVIAVELVSLLESRGYSGTLICIDGAPLLTKAIAMSIGAKTDENFQTTLVCYMVSHYVSFDQIEKYKDVIFKCKTWDERMNTGLELIKDKSSHDVEYLRLLANSIFRRLNAVLSYCPSWTKLKSNIKLIKPTQATVADLPEDHGLSEYFEKPVEIYTFEGNHSTILENESVADVINSYLHENTGSGSF